MKNGMYTTEQVHQVVEEVLRRLYGIAASSQERVNLDNSTPQQSSPGTKMTLTVREAAEMIGISKAKMYSLIREDKVPCTRVGKKILINRHAFLDGMWGGDNHGKKAC